MSFHNPPGGPHGFDKSFQERMNKNAKRAGIGFALWFAFCAVIGLAFLGLLGWAIIALVTWVTSQ